MPEVKLLNERQRVNMIPGMHQMARKSSLGRALNRMRRIFPDEFGFFPQTWMLPAQYDEFKAHCAMQAAAARATGGGGAEFEEEESGEDGGGLGRGGGSKKASARAAPGPDPATYIVKPSSGCQGTGIYLIRSPDQLHAMRDGAAVVQEYIPSPLLLGGLKFDFRLYVVVASLSPLVAYLSREGMARFATAAYQQPTDANLTDVFMHLTNYSLNKQNTDGYVPAGGARAPAPTAAPQPQQQHPTTEAQKPPSQRIPRSRAGSPVYDAQPVRPPSAVTLRPMERIPPFSSSPPLRASPEPHRGLPPLHHAAGSAPAPELFDTKFRLPRSVVPWPLHDIAITNIVTQGGAVGGAYMAQWSCKSIAIG